VAKDVQEGLVADLGIRLRGPNLLGHASAIPAPARTFITPSAKEDGRLARKLALTTSREVMLQPVDMIVAVENVGFADQLLEQWNRGLNAANHQLIQ